MTRLIKTIHEPRQHACRFPRNGPPGSRSKLFEKREPIVEAE